MTNPLDLEQLRHQLEDEYVHYSAPDNDGSGFLSFGELLALNEGSKAFNDEMARSGDVNKAQVLSDQVEEQVWEFAQQFKLNSEQQ
ncbi:hypothetical protein [Pusillimonas sp. NJUB218]|uniref:hypothetical protein n=1 Tax=Pusillimonas sp. NJUB218 TaxID=2023230 RepID=UPI000F4BD297|nr:hypothetical protein [Pusillimonas sp. NJUB218]ROT45605.1 hypothetical protein CHR62_07635 [Pusillimonas sp. NJUB218]